MASGFASASVLVAFTGAWLTDWLTDWLVGCLGKFFIALGLGKQTIVAIVEKSNESNNRKKKLK